MNSTLIQLHGGILTFRVTGPVDKARWRRAILPGVIFLRMQGGGSFLLPHTLDFSR